MTYFDSKHKFCRRETSESIMVNEEIFWIECDGEMIASKNFIKTDCPRKIQTWARIIFEEHETICPFR